MVSTYVDIISKFAIQLALGNFVVGTIQEASASYETDMQSLCTPILSVTLENIDFILTAHQRNRTTETIRCAIGSADWDRPL